MLNAPRARAPKSQAGVMLLEALIGILIFSLGILGMIGLQAASVSAAADAQYRSEASTFADQIVAQIWLNVDRTDDVTFATTLESFRYNVGGADCAFSGGPTDTSNIGLAGWVTAVTDTASSRLPGATAEMQQVLVDTAASNRVTVTVCWRAPNDARPRRHVVSANIS